MGLPPKRIRYRGANYVLADERAEPHDHPITELDKEKRIHPSFRELDTTIANTSEIESGAETVVFSARKLRGMLQNLRVQLDQLLRHEIDPTADTLDILNPDKRHEFSALVSDMAGANRMLNYTVDATIKSYHMAAHQIDALAEDYSAALKDHNRERSPKDLPDVVHVWSSDPEGI